MRESLLGCGLILVAAGCAAGCLVKNASTPAPTGPAAPPAAEPAPPAAEPAPPAAACDEPGGDVPADRTVAHRLQPTDALTGCTQRDDVDMYMLNVPTNAGGSLVTVTLRPEREMAPIVELFDENGKQVHRHATGQGEQLVSWAHVEAGTALYIRIAQVHGVTETYRLELAVTPLDEAGEPNDAQDTATAAELGSPVNGYLSGPVNRETGLVDWYRFDAGKPGQYTVMVDIGGEIAPQVEVYDANRKRLAAKSGGRGERITFDVKVARPGQIFISLKTGYTVEHAGKDAPPHHLTTPYILTLRR